MRTIIVETASRFARDLIVAETGFRRLRDAGITLIAADAPNSFLDDTPTSAFIRQVLAAVQELDKRNDRQQAQGRPPAQAGDRRQGRGPEDLRRGRSIPATVERAKALKAEGSDAAASRRAAGVGRPQDESRNAVSVHGGRSHDLRSDALTRPESKPFKGASRLSKRIFKPRAGRSPVRLSRITNQLKIEGTDGRSSQNRRLRDVVSAIASDFGGWDAMPETPRTLARQVATMAIQIEQLQAQMITAAPTVGQGEVPEPARQPPAADDGRTPRRRT